LSEKEREERRQARGKERERGERGGGGWLALLASTIPLDHTFISSLHGHEQSA